MPQLPCRCTQGAQSALDSLPQIWPPSAAGASAAALGQVKICGAGVSIKASALAPQATPCRVYTTSWVSDACVLGMPFLLDKGCSHAVRWQCITRRTARAAKIKSPLLASMWQCCVEAMTVVVICENTPECFRDCAGVGQLQGQPGDQPGLHMRAVAAAA